jgi:hypothetical protein
MADEFVNVLTTASVVESELARGRLESEGIPVLLKSGHPPAGAGAEDENHEQHADPTIAHRALPGVDQVSKRTAPPRLGVSR